MLSFLTKKKIDHNRLANVFVNSLLDVVDNGFPEVKAYIQDDPLFPIHPDLEGKEVNHFLMIVIVGNINNLPCYFSPVDSSKIEGLVIQKFAKVFEMDINEFGANVKSYDSFMSRVNHPSKNTLYSMSKAIFHKYELNNFQESYFKNMQVPNPIFLKKMDDIMANFIWDWEAFFKKYKLA